MQRKTNFDRLNAATRALRFVFMLGASLPLLAVPPSVTVSNRNLTITGIAPGSSVAVLSVAHEPMYYMMRVVSRHELLTDNDRDGKIAYEPPSGVAFRSIWIVVDMTTGEWTIASPYGFQPLEMKQKGQGRGTAVNLIANTLDVGRDQVDVLVVRPRAGAWAMSVRGGGTEDLPGQATGRIHIALGKLLPLRANFGLAPPVLTRGDLIALLDAERMEYWITKLDK